MGKIRFFLMISAISAIIVPGVSADGGVVRIGVNEVLSGPFKNIGLRVVEGIRTAAAEVNSGGGILGKKIELVIEDNELRTDMALSKPDKLIRNDGCQVVTHCMSSSIGLAIAGEMPQYKKMYLAICAESMSITGENYTPYTFRTCLNVGMHMKALALYFSKKGYKKVFLINQDYSWGHEIAKYYEKFIGETSPDTKIVGKEFHKLFNKSFFSHIKKIKASGADYVITGNWGSDLIQLILQARAMGLNIPIGCTYPDDELALSVLRESAKGCITANMYLLGLDAPQARAFEDVFHENSGGKWPNFAFMEGYIGIKMYFEAVRKAGSFETDAVIRAFEDLKYNGPAGTITIRKEDHQARQPVVIGEVVEKTKYYDHPFVRPVAVIPADDVSLSLEESGWKPWKAE